MVAVKTRRHAESPERSCELVVFILTVTITGDPIYTSSSVAEVFREGFRGYVQFNK